MTAQFVTIEPDVLFPYTLWEEGAEGTRALSRHADRADIPDGTPEYVFDGPSSSLPKSEANETQYPTVDRNGASLWPGARVRYQIEQKASTGVIYLRQGNATFEKVTLFGLLLECDDEHNLTPPHPSMPTGRTHRLDFACSYRNDGYLPGHLVADRSRSKPFLPSEPSETVVDIYVELLDDPRLVCHPQPRQPSPRP